jgi:hypothetical protein
MIYHAPVLIPPLPLGVIPIGSYSIPTARFTTCAYVSDGDANGVFTFLGALTTGTWGNPQTSGQIVLAASNLGSGTLAAIVNHDSSDTFNNPLSNNWFSVDLLTSRTLVVNKYSFRQRAAGVDLIVSMKLQGSIDNTSWTDITTADLPTQTANIWTSFSVPSAQSPYRYFRIVKNGNDTDGNGYFCIGEWELYGTLFY